MTPDTNEIDSGRVPDGTGLSQAEPQEGLGPSGFDPSRDCRWCFGGWYTSYSGGIAHKRPCDYCNREGVRR